jgi:electron transfer flavoprotein alpha subunit
MQQFEITSLIGLTSPAGRELLPRVAARLDAPLIMDCIEIDLDAAPGQTSQYSGKTIATIALTGDHFIYGMRANVVAPASKTRGGGSHRFRLRAGTGAAYQVIETRTDGSGPSTWPSRTSSSPAAGG